MSQILYQVDAFTAEPFKGNPAVVCLLEGPQPDNWMQNLAKEMNLSETAYLLPEGDAWRLRWFTPKREVSLCGHATLASAKVLYEIQPTLQKQPIRFQTRSGELLARWVDGKIELDFPAMEFKHFSYERTVDEVLGFTPREAVFAGNFFLFEAEDEKVIRKSQPDFTALEKLPMPEVIITSRTKDPAFDFISRFFAPQLGINEDPVTGSAHCLLAPYWAKKLGKSEFDAYQASQRGGKLHLKLVGDRVRISGAAKIIFRAELFV